MEENTNSSIPTDENAPSGSEGQEQFLDAAQDEVKPSPASAQGYGEARDSAGLEGSREAGDMPEAPGGHEAGSGSENDKIPPQNNGQPQPSPEATARQGGQVLEQNANFDEKSEARNPKSETNFNDQILNEQTAATTSKAEEPQNPLRAILERCKQAIAGRKQKKLEKVLEIMAQKKKVNNADICKVLRISSATATRYLDELEKFGKIRQVGKIGHEVFYELV